MFENLDLITKTACFLSLFAVIALVTSYIANSEYCFARKHVVGK